MSEPKIQSSDEAWEEGLLGADENYVKVVNPDMEAKIDAAAGTQLISIRLQKSMIEDFKMIAELNGGIGYQTLMKQILSRFVESEKKMILQEFVSRERERRQEKAESIKTPTTPPKKRKAG